MGNNKQVFFEQMEELLPNTREKCDESIKMHGEWLETVIIEDIFMPEILKLLSDDKKTETLKAVFDYIEKVVNEDNYLKDILSITIMEVLGNDKAVLKTAQKYMGDTSIKLQLEADKELGRT